MGTACGRAVSRVYGCDGLMSVVDGQNLGGFGGGFLHEFLGFGGQRVGRISVEATLLVAQSRSQRCWAMEMTSRESGGSFGLVLGLELFEKWVVIGLVFEGEDAEGGGVVVEGVGGAVLADGGFAGFGLGTGGARPVGGLFRKFRNRGERPGIAPELRPRGIASGNGI